MSHNSKTRPRSRSCSSPGTQPNAIPLKDLRPLADHQTTCSTQSREDETPTTDIKPCPYNAFENMSTHRSEVASGAAPPSTAPHSVASSSLYRWESNVGRSQPKVPSTLSSDDSLLQLQTAEMPIEARCRLPSSRSSLFGSMSSPATTNATSDSLEQLDRIQPLAPSDVPLPAIPKLSLPYSPAGSFESGSSLGDVYVVPDSLKQLQRIHPVVPSEMPLPESTDSLDVYGEDVTPSVELTDSANVHGKDSRSAGENYVLRTKRLARFLPHLETLEQKGRHELVGNVACVDYLHDGATLRIIAEINVTRYVFHDSALLSDLQRISSTVDDTTAMKLILVEDLCPTLINVLGTTFKLDPEFFAEHLNRSGYNTDDYGDAHPTRWNSAHLEKDYVSITWCRPVYQHPLVTEWLRTPSKLLKKQENLEDSSLGVSWRDAAFNDNNERNREAKFHKLRVDTNIFRQSWTLSARSNESYPDTVLQAADYHQLGHTIPDLVPTAWQERASFCRFVGSNGIPMGILLLDPLPAIKDLQTPLYNPETKEARPLMRRRGSTTLRQSPSTTAASQVVIEVALPMAPRALASTSPNKYRAKSAEVERLRHSFSHMPSTYKTILHDARFRVQHTHSDLPNSPLFSLLTIVERDTHAFFRALERLLEDISHDSLDDYLMTRRLSEWRKLLTEFAIEVPAISKRVEDFAFFVFDPNNVRMIPDEVNAILQTISQDALNVKKKLDDAYANLRVDMQFTESRRSINEAKTVTRLTELAFIFIPLSFCASLFSMSVYELDGGVSIWVYVVTALSMVVLAYTVRLVVGSELLARSTRKSFERVQARNGVKRGDIDQVPWPTILWLTVQEVWKAVGPARYLVIAGSLTLLGTLVPIVLMWTSNNLGNSFKIAITLLLILSTATGLLVRFGWRQLTPYRIHTLRESSRELFETPV